MHQQACTFIFFKKKQTLRDNAIYLSLDTCHANILHHTDCENQSNVVLKLALKLSQKIVSIKHKQKTTTHHVPIQFLNTHKQIILKKEICLNFKQNQNKFCNQTKKESFINYIEKYQIQEAMHHKHHT